MRARNIKPGFFENEDLAECDPLARILFTGLWCMADRAGRLENRPKRMKAKILPYDDCSIDDLLSQLEQREFIYCYQVKNKTYLQISKFSKHQRPHPKEAGSEIPAPEKDMPEHVPFHGKDVPFHGKDLHDPSSSLIPDSLIPDSLIPDSQKREEREEREEKILSCLRLFEPKRAFSDLSINTMAQTSTPKESGPSKESEPLKEPDYPEKSQKEPRGKSIQDSHPQLYGVAKSFLTAQQRQHPNKIKKIERRKICSSADTLRLLTENDGYELESEVIPALQWAIQDSFWSAQVLSLAGLRRKGKNGEMKFVNIMAAKERVKKQGAGHTSPEALHLIDEWHAKHEQKGDNDGEANGDVSEHWGGYAGMENQFQISDDRG